LIIPRVAILPGEACQDELQAPQALTGAALIAAGLAVIDRWMLWGLRLTNT
jgi:hypothetical protein